MPADDRLVERIAALSREGHPDRAIAERLAAQGVQSARQLPVSTGLVGKIRRAHQIVGVHQQFHAHEQVDGSWTIRGLARALRVRNRWLYDRIAKGTLPARRHPATGHYLIPKDPQVLASLQAERDALRHG